MSIRKGDFSGLVELCKLHLNYTRQVPERPLDVWPKFDDDMDAQVRRFQERAKLGVDGVIGPQTGNALNYFTRLKEVQTGDNKLVVPPPIPLTHLKREYKRKHELLFYYKASHFDGLSSLFPEPAETADVFSSSCPWMRVAFNEMGVQEVAGNKDNERVLMYSQGIKNLHKHDETPWCSAFANWVLLQAGIMGTRSGWARSFAHWGVSLGRDNPRWGAIAVFRRGDMGHVGFYTAESRTKVTVLGGNQDNRVKLKEYPKDGSHYSLIDYRWPTGWA